MKSQNLEGSQLFNSHKQKLSASVQLIKSTHIDIQHAQFRDDSQLNERGDQEPLSSTRKITKEPDLDMLLKKVQAQFNELRLASSIN